MDVKERKTEKDILPLTGPFCFSIMNMNTVHIADVRFI